MTTTELYYRLSASTLARIYYELKCSEAPEDVAESRRIHAEGVINAGQGDFDALVAEYEAEAVK